MCTHTGTLRVARAHTPGASSRAAVAAVGDAVLLFSCILCIGVRAAAVYMLRARTAERGCTHSRLCRRQQQRMGKQCCNALEHKLVTGRERGRAGRLHTSHTKWTSTRMIEAVPYFRVKSTLKYSQHPAAGKPSVKQVASVSDSSPGAEHTDGHGACVRHCSIFTDPRQTVALTRELSVTADVCHGWCVRSWRYAA